MIDVILDALLDSTKVLVVVLIINFALSFLESKIVEKFIKNNKYSPLLGAAIGLVPQCGFSIVAADMYQKQHISMGTLLAVFIACSDEALPMMISNPNKAIMILPLLVTKLVVGFSVGYLVDFIFIKKDRKIKESISCEKINYKGCCNHQIGNEHDESFVHEHILHPLIHSLKVFLYVLIINLIFGIVIYFIGENVISNFLISYKWITPLLTCLVGLIPNCASSVIITQLFLTGSISFGATLSGLICNAGLGLAFLLKDKNNFKKNLLIIGILIVTSLTVGFLTLLIEVMF